MVDVGWFLTMTLADNGGNQTTKTYRLRAADEIAAQAAASSIRASLNALTNSVEVAYAVSDRWENDSIVYPAAGIENEDKLSMTALLSGANKKANLKVPAPVIGAFIDTTGPGANICNTVATVVTDYTDEFKLAGNAFISDGEDLEELLSGKRISAKSNKG